MFQEATCIISTLPFTMVRRILITPALQGVQAAVVQQMSYGNQSHVWLRVKAPSWEVDGIEASTEHSRQTGIHRRSFMGAGVDHWRLQLRLTTSLRSRVEPANVEAARAVTFRW